MTKVIIAVMMLLALGTSMQAEAALTNLGKDNRGFRLIYDSDLDITWYDYTRSNDSWQNQVDWAAGLSVNFGETTFDDWRLPTTVNAPGSSGLNITSSEMGHLYYVELGNLAMYDTNGDIQPGFAQPGLANTGDFQFLRYDNYWSGTEYSGNPAYPAYAWYFDTNFGQQAISNKSGGLLGIAVLDGLAVVPEPLSTTLFLIGAATLGLRRFRKTK